MMKAIVAPLVALLALLGAPAGLGGTRTAGDRVVPADGGLEPADRQDRGDPEKQDEDACPTQLWSIPLEIEGLACILVLQSEDTKKQAVDPER